jgi:WD40 repeat protein
LATGGDDTSVKLWDVATGQERITLKGFTTAVRSLSFAPYDTLLAAGSLDGSVPICRAASNAEALAGRFFQWSESGGRRYVSRGYSGTQKLVSITDGLSNTFLIGEDIPALNNWCSWPYATHASGRCAIPHNAKQANSQPFDPNE